MRDRIGQIAPAYTAQQCPICDGWFYVMDGPFGENDLTKPISAFLHMEDAHPERLEGGEQVVGIPYCRWNSIPVTITVNIPKGATA